MNKRGDLAINLVIVAILGLVVMGIYFIIAGNTKGAFESGISQLIPNPMELQAKRCADIKVAVVGGPEDTDGDGVADICDICVKGNNAVDADGDFMPDACDRHVDKQGLPVVDTSPSVACCGTTAATCPFIVRNGRNFQCSPKK